MDSDSQVRFDCCDKCGSEAKRGIAPFEHMRRCSNKNCRKRWMVRTCSCGEVIDYRYQQHCKSVGKRCSISLSNKCESGNEASDMEVGSVPIMFCQTDGCLCHSSRWVCRTCSNCNHTIDYRYAAQCQCKACLDSRQYYRICPVCGMCPSQIERAAARSQVVRSKGKRKPRPTASKKVVGRRPDHQVQLSLVG